MARYKEAKDYDNWRRSYLKKLHRFQAKGHPIVYIDETGFAPTCHRDYAYGPVGQRIYGDVGSARRPRQSLVGGYCDGKLLAPVLFEGTCNTDLFNTWLQEQLLPVLPPRSVLVMDNATFHKSQETRDVIKAAGHFVLFLPPYSPHLNPIEKLWSNIKTAWKYQTQQNLYTILTSCKYCWN